MQKTRDYEHRFVSRGAVGTCRLRVYEELGERPVVVVTQRREPAGEPDPTSLLIASSVIAADLIEDGTLPEFYGRLEWREKAVARSSLQPIRDTAPFRFVAEYLEPRRRFSFIWFDRYDIVTPGRIGNRYPEDATREEVEELIGGSLDD